MKLTIVHAAVAAMTVISLAAPASAQGDRGRRSDENRHQSNERAQERGDRRETQPRQEARPREMVRPSIQQPRAIPAPQVQPRAQVVTPQVQPRANAVAPRVNGYAVPRGSVPPPAYNNNAQHYDNHYYNGHYDNHGYAYHPYYAPYYGHPVYHPYVFTPHYHLAFGVYVGYPVAYTYAYPYPVPVYGYGAPAAPVTVQPNSTYYGGIALEISPSEGQVYVDGNYAGTVRDFDGTNQPLTLTGGTHRVQIAEQGYQELDFDVQVQPGQVIPYQGTMQAY
jgi:hypothetical protein